VMKHVMNITEQEAKRRAENARKAALLASSKDTDAALENGTNVDGAVTAAPEIEPSAGNKMDVDSTEKDGTKETAVISASSRIDSAKEEENGSCNTAAQEDPPGFPPQVHCL
jgi:hypothetical protein